jgi:hypothetical protein
VTPTQESNIRPVALKISCREIQHSITSPGLPGLKALTSINSCHNSDTVGDQSMAVPAKSAFSVDKPYRWLASLAIVSTLLRVILVLRGGQLYWPDESRILRTWVVLKRPAGALAYILHIEPYTPSHWFYTILAIPFALVQALYMWLRDIPLNTETVKANLWVMALGTCLFSVACIILVYFIAKRAGATEFESLSAALFLATSTSILYYSRHLFCFDAGMALALLAMWIALKPGPLWRSVACGLIAGLAFSTYNGCWPMAGLALVVHTLRPLPTIPEFLKRSFVAGITMVLPYGTLELLTRLLGMPSYIFGMRGFMGAEIMGSFEEGWKFPAIYLWDCEHLILIVWIVLAVLAFRRSWLWLSLLLGTYLFLALPSHLHIVVVYGRTARQLIPFLCLAAAYGISRLPKPAAAAVLLLVVAQFACNISVPLRQHFPPLAPGQPHPLAWRPYQDEGVPASVRAQFRAGDYSWWFARGTK